MKEFNLSLKDRIVLSSTSDGEQLKWFYGNKFIKADTKGYESVAEVFASEFQKYIRNSNYIDYFQCGITEDSKTYLGCYSEKCNISLIPLFRFLEMYIPDIEVVLRNEENVYDYICYTISEITDIDFYKYLERLLIFDYLICNTDRHLNNIFIGVVDDYFVEAPILDNGAGFMSDLSKFPMDLTYNQLRERLLCKPFYSDFDKQIKLVENETLAIRYDDFIKDLEVKCVDFKYRYFERAKSILLHRLEETKNKLWIKC